MTDRDKPGMMNRRAAWVNCAVGVAGDMLLAALIDAGADRLAVMDAWSRLDLDGFAASWERVDRCGVAALWTNLVIDSHPLGGTEPSDHEVGHQHHPHRPAGEVIAMLAHADLPGRVRSDAIRVYRMLAGAEAKIHGHDPDQVELHEVGALDSILDVVGVCAALHDLDIDELSYSPIGLGAGMVRSAHGEIPHPAPATTELLANAGAVIVGVDSTIETATPTGVALLTALGVAAASPPTLRVDAVGYGAGTADPANRANVVQVLVGGSVSGVATDMTTGGLSADGHDAIVGGSTVERLVTLETNLDDTGGEVIAYTIERLLANGALDAWATPITMKKGRPAHTVHALAQPAQLGVLRDVLFAETGTLGVRVRYTDRIALERSVYTVEVDDRPVRIKAGRNRFKAEYEDVAAVARATGRSLRSITAAAEQAFSSEQVRDDQHIDRDDDSSRRD